MRESWRLVGMTSAARIYWVLALLLTTVITARGLGATGYGVLVAATAWVAMFATCGHLSLSQVVVFIAAGRRSEEWLPGVVGALGAILGVVAVVGSVTAATLYFASGGEIFQHIPAVTLLIAFGAFPLMLGVEGGNGVLMSIGELRVLSLSYVAGGTALLLFTFLAVGPLGLGIHGALAAFVLSQLTVAALTLGYIIQRAGGAAVERGTIRRLLAGGAKLHLNAIGTYLFTQANIVILNHYRAPSETAWFQLAMQIVTAMGIIPLAVGTVCYSLVSTQGPDLAWPQQRALLFEVLALVAALSVVAYVAAPALIPLIFGAAFTPSVLILRILLLAGIGMAMSAVMASQWISRGLFVQAALLTLLVGTATVMANWLVVPRYGMLGAAWVTVGTYLVSIVGNGSMALWVNGRWQRRQLAASARFSTPIG